MSETPSSEREGALARSQEAASLTDAELVHLVSAIESVSRAAEAAAVRVAAELAHRSRRELGAERLSARLGCRTAGELVRRATGVSGAAANRRIRLGLATRPDVGLGGAEVPARFAAVAAALASGTLGVEAAHAIVTTLEPVLRVADPAHVARAERELVGAATETWDAPGDETCTDPDEACDDPDGASTDPDERCNDDAGESYADQDRPCGDHDGPCARDRGDASARGRGCPVIDADSVRLQARVWAEYLDPDGGAPDERDEARRFLTLQSPRRGLVPISGLLLPQVAAALRRYTDAWTNPKTAPVPDPGVARRTQPAAGGPGVEPAGPETAGDGATGAEADDAPAETRSRAQVMHDVLATALNVAARVVDAPSVAGNAPTLVVVARESDLLAGGGVAQTDDGTPVSIAAARHVGCAGAVQRVSVDRTGRVVGLWSADRCFTGAQRRAIAVRDGGCVIPGCQVPAAWCEVHHVVPHADDPGGTTTDNGVLLCWHHHRTIDSGGWTIRMLDGAPWIRPPRWLDRTGRWRPAGPPGWWRDRRREASA
jgi:5-methylcytosine-specific restriction protein A